MLKMMLKKNQYSRNYLSDVGHWYHCLKNKAQTYKSTYLYGLRNLIPMSCDQQLESVSHNDQKQVYQW